MFSSKEDYEIWFDHIKELKEKELKKKGFDKLEEYIDKIADYGSKLDNTKWNWSKWADDKTKPDKRPPSLYPEVNDGQHIGQLFLDEETNELILKTKDGKKIIIKSLDDFKKIKTKFLLKK